MREDWRSLGARGGRRSDDAQGAREVGCREEGRICGAVHGGGRMGGAVVRTC